MTDNLRRRETLKTVLKRHRQTSRLLAESSQSEWRQIVGSGIDSGKYQQLAATTAELTRLLAPKISDSEYWDEPLTLIEVERVRSYARDRRVRHSDRDVSADDDRISVVDAETFEEMSGNEQSSLQSVVQRPGSASSSSYDSSTSQETVTETIEITLQWLADSDGTYHDLHYDGDEPFQARGMLSNVQPPEQVEKPLPPDAVRACHHALTTLMDELDILDYGDERDTEHPDPI